MARRVAVRLVRPYAAESDFLAAEGTTLDAKSVALVKLALALAAELEGGTHSAVRKALDAGCTREELLHVTLLATTTIGFPAMMRARSWVLDVLDGKPGMEK